jgi:hypothetical protein
MQLNNNEDIGWPEEEIMDDGEVTGPDLCGVVFKESCLSLVSSGAFLG